jgi:hypothetical protein
MHCLGGRGTSNNSTACRNVGGCGFLKLLVVVNRVVQLLLPPTARAGGTTPRVRLRITPFYKSFTVGEAVQLGVSAANYRKGLCKQGDGKVAENGRRRRIYLHPKDENCQTDVLPLKNGSKPPTVQPASGSTLRVEGVVTLVRV